MLCSFAKGNWGPNTKAVRRFRPQRHVSTSRCRNFSSVGRPSSPAPIFSRRDPSSARTLPDHLPGEPVFVLEPAARMLLAALGEPVPEIIDLRLVLAIDLERDGLVEGELRSAIEGREFLSRDLEVDPHHRGRLLAVNVLALVWIACDPDDLLVLEHRDVERRGLLGLSVEPQAWCDLLRDDLHDLLQDLTAKRDEDVGDQVLSALACSPPQQDLAVLTSS